MTGLSLTYAGVSYFNQTRPLETGLVQPDGVDLQFEPFDPVEELFRRMAQDAEFDVAEMSMSTYMLMVSKGDDRLVGLPIFPRRAFRQRQLYVHVDSGLEKPEDLRGRHVGVPEYQMTAAVWIRAFLNHDYKVQPEDVKWLTGGLVTPDYRERLHHDLPRGISLERIPSDRSLEEMLSTGELPALATARTPRDFKESEPGPIKRLFADYRSVERDYYQRTGLFPIMHMVVLNRHVYDTYPWVVTALMDAFHEAKELAHKRTNDADTLSVMRARLADELHSVEGLLGEDPFAYGVDANQTEIDAICQYSHEQGLASRLLRSEDLFPPEALYWAS